jgi:hypothetical protein
VGDFSIFKHLISTIHKYSDSQILAIRRGDLMKNFGIIMVIVGLSINAICVSASSEDAVTERYSGSENLPDEHAYWMFLTYVDGMSDNPEYARHVMEAVFDLDIDTPAGLARADDHMAWFASSSIELKQELESATRIALCPNGWTNMSYEDVKTARLEIEATKNSLYREYYDIALNRLSEQESEALRSYMLDLKRRTTFTRADVERHYGDRAESEARTYQASECAKFPHSLN